MAKEVNFQKIDNPVFSALSETHQNFCIDLGNLKVYQPETNPFGAFQNLENSVEEIDRYFEIAPKFFIFSEEKPEYSEKVEMLEVVINQMIHPGKIYLPITEEIVHLNGKFENELTELVQEFYPGFYRPKTHLLGNYYGIFNKRKLVAVTGERFQNEEFCEISAVVTNTAFTGRGYAQQLITFVNNKIISDGKIPFLHVDPKNTRAISVYEKLGFTLRKKVRIFYFRENKHTPLLKS